MTGATPNGRGVGPRLRRQLPMRVKRAASALLLVLTAAGACGGGEPTGPDDAFSGRYVLALADGAALPYTVFIDEIDDVPIRVLTAGSIALQSRGRLLDVRTFRLGQTAANATTETDSSFYSYQQEGSALRVTRPRINTAQSHVDSGTITSESITLSVRYVSAREGAPRSATLTYRRAP